MSEYRAKWAFIGANDKMIHAGGVVSGDAKYLMGLEAKGMIVKSTNKTPSPPENKGADLSAVENKSTPKRGRPAKKEQSND